MIIEYLDPWGSTRPGSRQDHDFAAALGVAARRWLL